MVVGQLDMKQKQQIGMISCIYNLHFEKETQDGLEKRTCPNAMLPNYAPLK